MTPAASTRYPDAVNADLLDRVPLSARHVLDVGCGTAALAREYRRRNPRAHLTGIERDPAAASVARTRLDQLFVADLDSEPMAFGPDIPAGGYDCMVYGDVLEHLRDPWSVLREQAAALSPHGTVLICVPNVEHWSFVDRLLRGHWRYDEIGLFDRTHLRWFNGETMQAAIAEAGLQPVDVAPRCFDMAAAEAFARTLAPVLQRLDVDVAAYVARCSPIQHVWRARRRAVAPVFVASTRLDPVGGVSEVRVTEPMQALASEPGIVARIAGPGDMLAPPDGMPRIFVLHRPALMGDEGLEFVRALIRRDWLLVCEFDDHPDYIPITQRPDVQNFRAVHAVQTSTEPLAQVLRGQNPEVAVFPNGVPRLPTPRNHAGAEHQTLFFGGLNRGDDWPALLSGLNGAAARAGDRLRFRIVADRALFDALETPYKEFHPLCDYETYQSLLAGCEISFMPLADTPFNRCKSDLKFLEAAAHRVTALASHVVYAGSIQDGRTGLLFRDALDLQQRLLRLVVDPEMGRAMGEAARAYVAGHRMLAYQSAARAAWYRSLWARRESLHRALLERVPELSAVPA